MGARGGNFACRSSGTERKCWNLSLSFGEGGGLGTSWTHTREGARSSGREPVGTAFRKNTCPVWKHSTLSSGGTFSEKR